MNRFSEHDASEAYFQRRRDRDEYEDDQWKAAVETEMERKAQDDARAEKEAK